MYFAMIKKNFKEKRNPIAINFGKNNFKSFKENFFISSLVK